MNVNASMQERAIARVPPVDKVDHQVAIDSGSSDVAESPPCETWPELPLTEVISKVIDNRGRSAPLAPAGIPLIATNCINEAGLYPTYENVRFVSDETYRTWFRGHPEPGDILLVNKGAPGRACKVPDPIDFCVAQDMVAIRANTRVVDRDFLFAAIRSRAFKEQVEGLHVGTMIPHLKRGDFRSLRVPIPPKHVQEAIGKIYIVLSEKIESNRRMNRTLETLAQRLFKSWFVDFDPVVARSQGRKPFGLGDELAALFPDAFEDSTLGPIPAGWRPSTIGQESTVVGGSTPSTDEPAYWNDGIHCWVTPRDLSKLSVPVLLDTDRRISDSGLRQISSGLLPVGTVLLSSRAPIGYIVVAGVPTAVNQGFIAIKCDGALPNQYVRQWLVENMDEIEARAGGTTFAEISKAAFRPISVVVPSSGLIEAFQAQTATMFNRVTRNAREMRTLAALRDLLLPKLLNGEIRVPVFEKAVESAL